MADMDAFSPVQSIPADRTEAPPSPGMALCLSGGGYRAMLFHAGALWRLNEAGLLPHLQRISSVSGGSITAGMLGLAWTDLAFDQNGVGQAFDAQVVAPIRALAGRDLDVRSVLKGLVWRGTAGDQIAAQLREHIFGSRTLQDFPDDADGPRFVINATNLQSGVLWRFSKPFARDYRVGEIKRPRFDVAQAVAASAAFPPLLSPVVLKVKESDFTPNSGEDLQRRPFTSKVVLTDGGVYDNLGLETVWKRYQTVFVSDGGGYMEPDGKPARDWLRQTVRVLNVIDSQVRSLRKRQVIESYRLPAGNPLHRDGAYWGIRSNIADFKLADPLDCPFDQTIRLADIQTRLTSLDRTTQERLINWGYAICDTALRKHVDPSLPRPADFPYPAAKVG